MVVLVLDAAEGISEQDAHVAGYILERGRALVVAVNKWDAGGQGRARAHQARAARGSSASSVSPTTHFISAKTGKGLGERDALGRRRLRRGDGEAADAQADARADRGGRAPAAAAPGAARAPSCATRTRAATIRRASSSTAIRCSTCPTPTGATSRASSATPSSCRARRSRIEFRTGRNPYAERDERASAQARHRAQQVGAARQVRRPGESAGTLGGAP